MGILQEFFLKYIQIFADINLIGSTPLRLPYSFSEVKMDKITTELELDGYLYEFYETIARKSNKSVKTVLEDSLFKFAGFLSLEAIKKSRDS